MLALSAVRKQAVSPRRLARKRTPGRRCGGQAHRRRLTNLKSGGGPRGGPGTREHWRGPVTTRRHDPPADSHAPGRRRRLACRRRSVGQMRAWPAENRTRPFDSDPGAGPDRAGPDPVPRSSAARLAAQPARPGTAAGAPPPAAAAILGLGPADAQPSHSAIPLH